MCIIHKKKNTQNPSNFLPCRADFLKKHHFLIFDHKNEKIFKNGRFFARPWCDLHMAEIHFFEIPGKSSFESMKGPKTGQKIWNPDTSSGIHDFLSHFWPTFCDVPLMKWKKNDFVIFVDFRRFSLNLRTSFCGKK